MSMNIWLYWRIHKNSMHLDIWYYQDAVMCHVEHIKSVLCLRGWPCMIIYVISSGEYTAMLTIVSISLNIGVEKNLLEVKNSEKSWVV